MPKIATVLYVLYAGLLLLLVPANGYDWMRELDPAARLPADPNRDIRLIVILVPLAAMWAIPFVDRAPRRRRWHVAVLLGLTVAAVVKVA